MVVGVWLLVGLAIASLAGMAVPSRKAENACFSLAILLGIGLVFWAVLMGVN